MQSMQVVVIGVDHFNTLGIIRSLGEVGISPIALILTDHNKAWTLKSKYVNKNESRIVSYNTALESLKIIGDKFRKEIYLIPSCDTAVKLIDDNYDILKNFYCIPNIYNGRERMTRCLDKKYSVEMAKKAGFKIPKTDSFRANDKESIDEIKHKYRNLYPLIIKEDSSAAGKNHTIIIENELALIKAIEQCGEDLLMIQEYIIKDEELGIQGVGFGEFEPFIPATIHKIRTSIDSMGSTTYAEIKNDVDPNLRDYCEKYIKLLEYFGIFDIEVMKKNDDYYFIECNFRNGAYGYAYTKMGYNLPLIWITRQKPDKSGITNLRLINGFNDVKHVLHGNVSLFRWVKELLGARIKLTAQAKDMLPFFARVIGR